MSSPCCMGLAARGECTCHPRPLAVKWRAWDVETEYTIDPAARQSLAALPLTDPTACVDCGGRTVVMIAVETLRGEQWLCSRCAETD